ncbi:uncharacterized protein EKO05_0000051 [Ascochyta rabiei]|uniref:uncharacterized protein n=1 Tax=Didymella rabiei TaxID=5454 RepID=UPI0022012ACE|nr:uncharacterized protein EKO05_0000051 [Ascochyta rabiei]UPX09361.1 hypothetical protein EKO05_0000051 [Ascochyta rabiei]
MLAVGCARRRRTLALKILMVSEHWSIMETSMIVSQVERLLVRHGVGCVTAVLGRIELGRARCSFPQIWHHSTQHQHQPSPALIPVLLDRLR